MNRFAAMVFGVLAAASLFSMPALAADDAEQAEAARREAFRHGMETIVSDLNDSRYGSFIDAIDRDAMVQRIFGLRLIDQQVKRGFLERLDYTWDAFIAAQFPEHKDTGLKVTLLGVESRGDQGRAVVRFDLPKFQFGYHEYELRLREGNGLEVVDWTDYGDGTVFSRSTGEWLVSGAPSDPALRKLVDFNPAGNELFQFRELIKAVRDGNLAKYLEILGRLPERLQRQRVVVESTVQLARRVRKRREMIAGLEAMARYYPNEPLYGLMLLDYYFPRKQFDEATAALEGVYRRLGFPDAAMEARLSAAKLAGGDTADALARAARALELEPGLELAWWSALNARAANGEFAAAVEALGALEDEYGYTLDAEMLGRNPAYRGLVASDEYRAWREGR